VKADKASSTCNQYLFWPKKFHLFFNPILLYVLYVLVCLVAAFEDFSA